MKGNVAAFISGLLFATGLAIGGMTDPAKILAFLDITGDWDPSMILVMGGAVTVYTVGFRLIVRRPAPVFSPRFVLPAARAVDARLITGAAIFGVGWGLAGLCPGPALTSLATGSAGVIAFVATMLVGLWIPATGGGR